MDRAGGPAPIRRRRFSKEFKRQVVEETLVRDAPPVDHQYSTGGDGICANRSGANKGSDQAPDVPTIAEGGLLGFSFEPFYAIVVTAGTPREIVSALSEGIAKGMSAPEFRAQFVKTVASPVTLSTPDQMTQRARQEAELIERIVRTAGVKLE
jgi:tripartite-type tricarboxylate transporter receptor subunit TctC